MWVGVALLTMIRLPFAYDWPPATLLLVVLATGCGSDRSQVTGRVTYDDGSPVPGGTVIAEATIDGKLVGVQANIESDGTFRLGTDRPGDGALPGSYRVLLVSVALSDFELSAGKKEAIGGKYTKYETSGITFEVKPGKNEFNITVAKPGP